jgi:hypothetical protein
MHFRKGFPPLGMKVCNNCTCANDNLGMEFKMHMCVGTLHCIFNFSSPYMLWLYDFYGVVLAMSIPTHR